MKLQEILNQILQRGSISARTKAFMLYMLNADSLEDDLLNLAVKEGIVKKNTTLYK